MPRPVPATCKSHYPPFHHLDLKVDGIDDVDLGFHFTSQVEDGDNRPYLRLEVSLRRESQPSAWRPTLQYGLLNWTGDLLAEPSEEDRNRLLELATPFIRQAVAEWFRGEEPAAIRRPKFFTA